VNLAELDAAGLELHELEGGVVDDDVDAVQEREGPLRRRGTGRRPRSAVRRRRAV
jgi:hypothetical protein